MAYEIEQSKRFKRELNAQVDYLLAEGAGVDVVMKWLDRLQELFNSLDEMPLRYPVDELQTLAAPFEVRKFSYGDYLIFYHVDEDQKVVELLHFRHGARHRGK